MADDGLMSYFAKIGLDSSNFLNGISKADSGVLQFYRDVSVSMAATMMVFDKVMAYGSQFVNLANQASEYVSTIDKLSVTTGMSTEELQRWSTVARYADSDIGSLATMINRLQLNLNDQGEAGDRARKILDDMGVSYRNTDGSLKSANEIFPQMIAGLGGLSSSADRVTASNALVGRGYQELAGYIDLGKEGIVDYYNTANVMSEEQTQSLRDYETATKDLTTSTTNLANTAGAELAPSFTEVSQLLNDLAGNEAVISFFSWLNDALTLVARGFHIMGAEATAAYQMLRGDSTGAKETMDSLSKWVMQKQRDDAMKDAGYRTDGYGNVIIEDTAEKAAAGKLTPGKDTAEEERLKSLKAATDDYTKSVEDLASAYDDLNNIETDYSRKMSVLNPRDVSGARSLIMQHQWDVEDQQKKIGAAQGNVAVAAAGTAKYGDVIVKVGEKEVARVQGVAAGNGERSLTQAGY